MAPDEMGETVTHNQDTSHECRTSATPGFSWCSVLCRVFIVRGIACEVGMVAIGRPEACQRWPRRWVTRSRA